MTWTKEKDPSEGSFFDTMLLSPHDEMLQVGPPGEDSTAVNKIMSERAGSPFSALILAVLRPTMEFTVESKVENRLETFFGTHPVL